MCLQIPPRLHSGEQLPDNSFDPGELIYRRVKTQIDGLGDTKYYTEVFPLKNDSYNRSKYSGDIDVLYSVKKNQPHFNNDGIIAIRIAELQDVLIAHPTDAKKYTLAPRHAQLHCMYPHIEVDVIVDENGNKSPTDQINSKVVKTSFRLQLGKIINYIKEPGGITNLDLVDTSCSHFEN